jgi:hypothetical protein
VAGGGHRGHIEVPVELDLDLVAVRPEKLDLVGVPIGPLTLDLDHVGGGEQLRGGHGLVGDLIGHGRGGPGLVHSQERDGRADQHHGGDGGHQRGRPRGVPPPTPLPVGRVGPGERARDLCGWLELENGVALRLLERDVVAMCESGTQVAIGPVSQLHGDPVDDLPALPHATRDVPPEVGNIGLNGA